MEAGSGGRGMGRGVGGEVVDFGQSWSMLILRWIELMVLLKPGSARRILDSEMEAQ